MKLIFMAADGPTGIQGAPCFLCAAKLMLLKYKALM